MSSTEHTPQPVVEDPQQTARLHPKLRMLRNGATAVNLVRSELSGSVVAGEDVPLDQIELALPNASEQRTAAQPRPTPADRDEPDTEALPDATISVFVQLTSAPSAGGEVFEVVGEQAQQGDLIIADLPASAISDVASQSAVSFVEPGEAVNHPRPAISTATPKERIRPSFLSDDRLDEIDHGDGTGVLVGIVDVEGFDFAHPDFLNEDDSTRFVSIWDQGGDVRPPPAGIGYGSEFTKDHLDAALDQQGFAPTRFEPQSAMKPGSHGTHVASIAAGNTGICNKAEIAGVLIALSDDDLERRRSLYDSTRIAHAALYLARLADARGKRLVLNVSLGTNGHAHDASSPTSRWLDSLLVTPGRVACVAAGNAGQMDPTEQSRIGHIAGRIHRRGRIAAAGLRDELQWIVVGDGVEDVSENELEIWYPPQDRFAVQVKPPGGDWSAAVEPRHFLENHPLADGTRLSIYNEVYHPANGANHISVFLSPFLDPSFVRGIAHGVWRVRLIGLEVREGNYDCWIERDDPRPIDPGVGGGRWRFPSFFADNSFSRRATVSSLACGQRIVSVANYHPTAEAINVTSSLGPTRDGRNKPDIAAPGTDIVAAKGFAGPDDRWIAMSGTSMASPFVAGVAGLMLAVEPELTAAQVVGIIRRTAQPLPGADFEWKQDAGFGALDAAASIAEAARFKPYTDLDHTEADL